MVDIDADAGNSEGHGAGFYFAFDEDAANLAFADEQIIGPAEIDGEPGGPANGMGGSEAGREWQQRQACGRDGWA